MKRVIVLLACVACAAAGVAVGMVVAHHSPAPVRYANIDQAIVSGDGMMIGTSTGDCPGGPLTATETATAVTLRLAIPDDRRFTGICAIQAFSVRLKAPLGDRTLIDGTSGRVLPSFSTAGILRPGHLPGGFTLAYDTANLAADRDSDEPTGPGCVQVYVKDGQYDDTLLITQIVGPTAVLPTRADSTRITVRGQPGIAFPGEIEWTERGQLITIRSMTYAYAVLPTAELVAVGNSLR